MKPLHIAVSLLDVHFVLEVEVGGARFDRCDRILRRHGKNVDEKIGSKPPGNSEKLPYSP